MPNAIMQCIRARRSVRRYTDKPVDENHIETLIEAARWAPSGGNNQTAHFAVISNTDELHSLNSLIRAAFLTWQPDDNYGPKLAAKKKAENEQVNFFFHAPLLVIASNEEHYQNGMADCATALQNILLAATSLGLGSCWVNQLRWLREEETIRDFLTRFGVPRNHLVCGGAVIGHSETVPSAPARKEGTWTLTR